MRAGSHVAFERGINPCCGFADQLSGLPTARNEGMEGRVGFEPTTSRLKVGRSTTELTALEGARVAALAR